MNDLIVSKVDRARSLLAEAKDAPAAKRVADMAHAAEVYAKRQKLSEEAIAYAHAVKIDAMRLLGEFLKREPKNKGTLKRGPAVPKENSGQIPTRQELLGKDGRKVSSQAQKLAAIAESGNGLFEEVRSGKKTIAQAEREVQRARKRDDLEAKAAATKHRSDLWKIITGDCLRVMAGMGAGTARIGFADPPYNIGIDYGEGESADLMPEREYLVWCRKWMGECVRLLTPDGSLWVLINDEWAAEFGMILKHDLKLTVRSWVKWYETFGVNCSNNFNRCSRHLFYCVKDPKRFVFNADAVCRPSDRQTKYGDKRADPGGKVWDNVWCIPRLVENAKERLPDFPTQLPIDLLTPIVGCASEPGDLVLDPFCGSGTTGVASVIQGRQFLGIEKSKRFAELASLRLKATE